MKILVKIIVQNSHLAAFWLFSAFVLFLFSFLPCNAEKNGLVVCVVILYWSKGDNLIQQL